MNMRSIFVRASWDDEAEVWVATSRDIEGLAVESETMETLQPKVMAAVADLLELNGIGSDLPEIPVHILAEQIGKVPNPSF
ncbi:DUF1902 domain-containing protein [Rhizobium sp. WL3]|uniref:DUF1902 domain-containing protein n=1 Tax=Rhizobium sp. WL3 TaxID=2603277 RepID=UPI0011C1D59D|nr:DUF1902 domain-containing protein [Rhizobium sp. WL3]MBX9467448.1 DUF1902 domain-containing protein [Rhizobium sp.]QEE46941.1 DUF1902 domain-containing protein [Rhizobium sp. WL3]